MRDFYITIYYKGLRHHDQNEKSKGIKIITFVCIYIFYIVILYCLYIIYSVKNKKTSIIYTKVSHSAVASMTNLGNTTLTH